MQPSFAHSNAAAAPTSASAPLPLQVQHFAPDVPYASVLAQQETAVHQVLAGGPEQLFIGQHAPTFTAGTSSELAADVPNPAALQTSGIPVIHTGRGGRLTYHGPGQLVAYPIVNLAHRGRDVRAYIKALQYAVLETIRTYGVRGHLDGDVGVWVSTPHNGVCKIAAIGVRVRKWVAFHGVALNVAPDLAAYRHIIPCGIHDKGQTSLAALGIAAQVEEVEQQFIKQLQTHLQPSAFVAPNP